MVLAVQHEERVDLLHPGVGLVVVVVGRVESVLLEEGWFVLAYLSFSVLRPGKLTSWLEDSSESFLCCDRRSKTALLHDPVSSPSLAEGPGLVQTTAGSPAVSSAQSASAVLSLVGQAASPARIAPSGQATVCAVPPTLSGAAPSQTQAAASVSQAPVLGVPSPVPYEAAPALCPVQVPLSPLLALAEDAACLEPPVHAASVHLPALGLSLVSVSLVLDSLQLVASPALESSTPLLFQPIQTAHFAAGPSEVSPAFEAAEAG